MWGLVTPFSGNEVTVLTMAIAMPVLCLALVFPVLRRVAPGQARHREFKRAPTLVR